jgi:hypothetical protein
MNACSIKFVPVIAGCIHLFVTVVAGCIHMSTTVIPGCIHLFDFISLFEVSVPTADEDELLPLKLEGESLLTLSEQLANVTACVESIPHEI